MTHLFLSEPPLRFGQNEPPGDLADRLQALVDQGRNEEAVLLFLQEHVGMPEPAIEQLRASPAFAGFIPLAQTTVYDNRLVASVSTPTAAMLGVDVPTTLLRGDPTMPLIVTAVERLAAAMPGPADHRCARRGPLAGKGLSLARRHPDPRPRPRRSTGARCFQAFASRCRSSSRADHRGAPITSGYSSLRHARGSESSAPFGVRSSRNV
jgi:hypothetical protein